MLSRPASTYLALAVLAIAGTVACTLKGVKDRCESDADCLQGNVCSEGRCRAPHGGGDGGSSSEPWKPIPIRTQAMKSAGHLGGDGTQLVLALEYAPSNPLIIYLATDGAAVWKSTNGGRTWFPKNGGFSPSGALSLAIHPSNPNVVLAATGQLGYADPLTVDFVKGIYRTTDGGENWVDVRPNTLFMAFLGALPGGRKLVFSDPDTVFAGTWNEGLFRSTDVGITWHESGFAKCTIQDIVPVPGDPATRYVVVAQSRGTIPLGIYRHTQSDITRLAATGLPQLPRQLAIGPSAPNVIYAAAGGAGVYRSLNAGSTFEPLNSGMSNSLLRMASASWVAVSPVNPQLLYVSWDKNDFYVSTNGGAFWFRPVFDSQSPEPGPLRWINNSFFGENIPATTPWQSGPIAVHPTIAGEAMAVGAGYHLHRTTDSGTTWEWSNDGYNGLRLGGDTGIGWDANDKARFLVLGGEWGSFLTTDGGDTFRFLKVPQVFSTSSSVAGDLDPTPSSARAVIATGEADRYAVAVSNNINNSSPDWTIHLQTAGSINFVRFNRNDPNVIYAGAWRSTNKGVNWDRMAYAARAVWQENNDRVYGISGSAGLISIAKSTDQGRTWTDNLYPKFAVALGSISAMAVDATDEDRVYVASELEGVYTVTPARRTLARLPAGWLGAPYVSHLAADPRKPGIVYAGTGARHKGQSLGVFRSTDGGESFVHISAPLQAITVHGLSVSPHSLELFLGSSHGTWRHPPPPE